jgi:hypothetical protein
MDMCGDPDERATCLWNGKLGETALSFVKIECQLSLTDINREKVPRITREAVRWGTGGEGLTSAASSLERGSLNLKLLHTVAPKLDFDSLISGINTVSIPESVGIDSY